MPPKQRITREMIMESAFDMFCREGMDVVNARSVAKALGCSTQPIFSYYTGMQELRSTIDLKAQEMFSLQVLSVAKSDSWLTDLCEAFVRFARENPHVYTHLYASICSDKARLDALAPIAEEMVGHVAQLEGITVQQAAELCRETVIYAVGLAAASIVGYGMSGDIHADIEKAYRAYLAALA